MLSKKMKNNIAIKFDSVSKLYYLQSHRTLKEFLPAFLKKKAPKTLRRVARQFYALKNISFKIKKGETVGIIGPNGAGKSTILKLIAGVTKPTRGKITVNGQVSPLIELGAGFHPDLTGRENIYLNGSILGLTKKKIDKKFKEIVDFAELWDFIDQPVKHYSSGMYARLGFSIAISVEPEILLIDEILAVGDAAFQEKCFAKMEEFKKSGVTIIYVSHSLPSVAKFCNHCLYLDKSKLISEGNPQEIIENYLRTEKKVSSQQYHQTPEKSSIEAIDPSWYKNFVGGMWEEIGKLQFDFLIKQGLKPENKLLDLGCGSLRGGIHFIKYLKKGNYFGIDVRKDILIAAEKEIKINKLSNKNPQLFQITDNKYDDHLKEKFDFILAVSVFTHLNLNEVAICLYEAKKILKKKGNFFATYFESEKCVFDTNGFLQVEKPDKVITLFHKDPYHYCFSLIKEVAKLIGLKAKVIKNWKHPRNQKMLVFRHQ